MAPDNLSVKVGSNAVPTDERVSSTLTHIGQLWLRTRTSCVRHFCKHAQIEVHRSFQHSSWIERLKFRIISLDRTSQDEVSRSNGYLPSPQSCIPGWRFVTCIRQNMGPEGVQTLIAGFALNHLERLPRKRPTARTSAPGRVCD